MTTLSSPGVGLKRPDAGAVRLHPGGVSPGPGAEGDPVT
jgi:hypothetical protein